MIQWGWRSGGRRRKMIQLLDWELVEREQEGGVEERENKTNLVSCFTMIDDAHRAHPTYAIC